MSERITIFSLITILGESFRDLLSTWLLLLAVAVFLPLNAPANSITVVTESDLDRDGRVERIELNSDRAPTLNVWHNDRLMWSGIPRSWKPWKLEIADVDGDGKLEIVVGVFKSTKFFPKPHNCLFIYGWAGDHAFPKWLGSSLGRPFTDFLFADLDGQTGDELIAMESSLEGKKSVSAYRWNGFGFTLDWRDGDWQTAKLIDAKNGEIFLEADGKLITAAARTGAGYEK